MASGYNTFEGGTDGVTITDANSGGISGNATNGTVHGATNTMEYDTDSPISGLVSARFAMPATVTEQSYLEWAPLGLGTGNVWIAIEYKKVANPTGTFFYLARLDDTSDVRTLGLCIRNDGLIRIDGSGAEETELRSTTAIPNNQSVRIEVRINPTTPAIEWWLYLNKDSDTADESLSSTAVTVTGLGINEVLSGVISTLTNMNGAEWRVDNVRWSNEAKLGPYVPPVERQSIIIPRRRRVMARR